MPAPRTSCGTTLLEAMVALVVMLIGALGVISLHQQGLVLNADARRIMRASAIAQDLVDNIDHWPYTDPRLANSNGDNDADVGDTAQAFEGASPPADHGEADLTTGGTTWTGIPTANMGEFERYWNVAYPDDSDGNGTPDGVRVAVVVRWPLGPNRWRRIVSLTTKFNPSEQR